MDRRLVLWVDFGVSVVWIGVGFVVVVLWQRWVCCGGAVVVYNGNIKHL